MPDKVTVIVPAYNEAENIISVLKPLLQWQRAHPKNRHVAVVDDGSRDATAKIAKKMGVRVISSDPKKRRNMGKGKAFIAGAKYARKNGSTVLVTLDADLFNVTPEKVDTMVKELKTSKANMVIALARESGPALEGGIVVQQSSGQRAIRISVLEPLFKGKGKWAETMKGYGLEAALNHLIPKKHILECLFVADSPFRKGGIRQTTESGRTRTLIYSRRDLAKRLRAWRAVGNRKQAQASLKRAKKAHRHFR